MERQKGLPTLPGSRTTYVSLTFTILLAAIAIIAQAIFLARAVTQLFAGVPFFSILPEVSLFFAAFIARHSLVKLEEFIAERFARRASKDLQTQLIQAYFQLGQRFVHRSGTGRLVTLAVEGIEQIKTYLEIAIPKMIRSVIVPMAIVIYVFTLDTASAVILIVTVPIVVIFMILLGLAAQKMADKQYDTYRLLSNHFLDTLKGLETLAYLGQSDKHDTKIARVSERYRKATMRTLRVAFLSSFALDFFTSLSIAFVAVGLGFRLIDGTLILLPALTILLLAPEYFLPIREVGSDYHATLDGQVALVQVETILQEKDKLSLQKEEKHSSVRWEETSTIALQRISASHETEETPILSEISFYWQGTGAIGIVGKSGAGKSTLIDVLAGFLQVTSGQIEVNGETCDLFLNDDWPTQIAYIPQSPYIFPATLADNIRFYEPSASDEDVMKIVQNIGLASFVEQLPMGIHERIGEGGRSLSGGQEQRIAMARALISKKPILLLDEPTAHLDIETEFEMKQLMNKLFRNKLVFLATHRLHWMNELDHILLLEKGRLVENGTHEELLANRGAYSEFVTMLAGGETN